MRPNRLRAFFALSACLGVALSAALALYVPSADAAAQRPNPYALAEVLNGSPTYLGTIDATTTSKTNAQATTTFNTSGDHLAGKVLLIQNTGSVDVRVYAVSASDGTVSNTRGAGFAPAISAGERVILTMPAGTGYLAGITTSSTANIDVWELQ